MSNREKVNDKSDGRGCIGCSLEEGKTCEGCTHKDDIVDKAKAANLGIEYRETEL